MMIEQEKIEYTVYIPKDFDEEVSMFETKGFFSYAYVKAYGKIYRPHFINTRKILRFCDDNFQRNKACYTEPNMVLVQEITRENILNAIKELVESRFWGQIPEDNPKFSEDFEYEEMRFSIASVK